MRDITVESYSEVYRDYEDYMLLKNYSRATIKTYLSNFRKYYEWCIEHQQKDMYLQETVRQYLLDRVRNGAK